MHGKKADKDVQPSRSPSWTSPSLIASWPPPPTLPVRQVSDALNMVVLEPALDVQALSAATMIDAMHNPCPSPRWLLRARWHPGQHLRVRTCSQGRLARPAPPLTQLWLAKAPRLNAFCLQLGAQRLAPQQPLASSDAPAALWMPYPPCPASQKARARGCPSQSPCRRRARTSAAPPRCARGGGFGTWSILRCDRCPWPRPALRAPRRVDGWVGIGGRAQQLARIGFEVKALVNANHGRPMAGVHPLWHGKREGGACAAPARWAARPPWRPPHPPTRPRH